MTVSSGAARVCARVAAVILAAVAVFQFALALGAPWGAVTQGGSNAGTLPTSGRALAVVSMALLLVMAGAILARVDDGPLRRLPRRIVTALAWFTTVYSGLSVVLNVATPSTRERALWAPVAVVLLVLVVVAMVGSRRGRMRSGVDERDLP